MADNKPEFHSGYSHCQALQQGTGSDVKYQLSSAGTPTTLVCLINEDNLDSVEWFYQGRRCIDGKYHVMNDSEHRWYLYINNTTTNDEGAYRVVVTNDQGESEEVIMLSVIKPAIPKSDENHKELQVHEFLNMFSKYGSYRMRKDFFNVAIQARIRFLISLLDIELPMELTQHAANLPCNLYKNRYCNVFPYDHTRVVLSLIEETPGSDYINASHIDDAYTLKGYIASQGPIPNTFEDHWRMIWENNIYVMAMVTRTMEKRSVKCHQYWPIKGSSMYGKYCVSLKKEEILPHYAVRTFVISNKCVSDDQSKISHEIQQIQFLSWPEYGVPAKATEMLDFRKRVFECHSAAAGPLLVHCSAGVGRTGTFICIDSLLKRIESGGTVDIFNFIRQLRYKRERTVETEEQYKFIHDVLAEFITKAKQHELDCSYLN